MTASTTSLMGNRKAELQSYLGRLEALVRAGHNARASRLAVEAVARGHEHVNLFVLAAYDHIAQGKFEDAFACATRAQELGPRSPDALNVRGLALAQLNRHREAIGMYDAALRQAPGAAHLHFNKGRALEDLNETRAARTQYERALGQQGNHSEALARLANLAALSGDVSGARGYAGRALKFDPQSAAARLALAMADITEGNFDPAITTLAPLVKESTLGPVNTSIAQGLMGDALDGLGRGDDAFTAYRASNDAMKRFFAPTYEAPGVETASERIARLITFFQDAPEEQWRIREGVSRSSSRCHVFLVGFPRSGTTLLEQILDAHPEIETLEERDCLADAFEAFVMPKDGIYQLASTGYQALSPYREAYWKAAALHGMSNKSRVFVDKLPLNSVLLCLIAKLFPDAKIVFALRDPRDVVLSCFRRRFMMTPQMYELLTLEGAANYYASVMTLADVYKDKLALPTCLLRYEDIVREFDAEVYKLCNFLGLDWQDSMRDFAAMARAKEINTPSAAQVVRGLYMQGIGQWRRYKTQLAPVLPTLAPWVARFGYSEN